MTESPPIGAPPTRPPIMEIQLAQAAIYREQAHERFKFVNSLVLTCLRTLLLFNGGAVVGLFTVLGHGIAGTSAQKLVPAFAFFVAGVVSAMISLGLAFLNQEWFWRIEIEQATILYTQIHDTQFGAAPRSATAPSHGWAILARSIAISLAWASLAAFTAGSIAALFEVAPAR